MCAPVALATPPDGPAPVVAGDEAAPAADEGAAPFTMTMEFSDFGKPVDVRPPAQEDVQELSDLLSRLA